MTRKGLAPILIVLILAALVGGYLIYTNYSNNRSKTTQSTPSPIASPAPTGTGETANWKTYTNTKYKYAVKYPNDFIIESATSPELVTFSGKTLQTGCTPLVYIRVLETFKLKSKDNNYTTEYSSEYKVLEKNGYTFFFNASAYTEGCWPSKELEVLLKSTLNKIYSTFRFLP